MSLTVGGFVAEFLGVGIVLLCVVSFIKTVFTSEHKVKAVGECFSLFIIVSL